MRVILRVIGRKKARVGEMAGLAALGAALHRETPIYPEHGKKVAGTLRVPSAFSATARGACLLLSVGENHART